MAALLGNPAVPDELVTGVFRAGIVGMRRGIA